MSTKTYFRISVDVPKNPTHGPAGVDFHSIPDISLLSGISKKVRYNYGKEIKCHVMSCTTVKFTNFVLI